MTDAVHRWIETLPLRWALGGLVVGAAIALFLFAITEPWSIDSITWLTGVLMHVLLPSAALGLLWGWHERRAMRAALADGPVIIDHRIRNEYRFVQAGKGAACGLLLGLLYVATAVFGLRTTELGPLPELAMTTTFVGVGAGIGVLVGHVARWSMRRRLASVRAG